MSRYGFMTEEIDTTTSKYSFMTEEEPSRLSSFMDKVARAKETVFPETFEKPKEELLSPKDLGPIREALGAPAEVEPSWYEREIAEPARGISLRHIPEHFKPKPTPVEQIPQFTGFQAAEAATTAVPAPTPPRDTTMRAPEAGEMEPPESPEMREAIEKQPGLGKKWLKQAVGIALFFKEPGEMLGKSMGVVKVPVSGKLVPVPKPTKETAKIAWDILKSIPIASMQQGVMLSELQDPLKAFVTTPEGRMTKQSAITYFVEHLPEQLATGAMTAGILSGIGGKITKLKAGKPTPVAKPTLVEEPSVGALQARQAELLEGAKVEVPAVTPKVEVPEPTGTVKLSKAGQDAIRKELDQPTLTPAKRKSFEQSLKEAETGRFDEKALSIAEEAIVSDRVITDVEHAGMVRKAAQLMDQKDYHLTEASKLIEVGNERSGAVERSRANAIAEQIEILTDGSRQGGRELGRAMSIRRIELNRHTYDIASITQQARAAKGSKLTTKEHTRYDKLAKEHTTLEKKMAEVEAENARLLTKQEELVANLVAKNEVVKVGRVKRTAESKANILSDRANIKKQLTELGFRVNDVSGVTAEGAYLVGRLATTYIKEGALTLKDVVAKVLEDLPQLTEYDVYRSLAAKNPKAQKRARLDVTKRIRQLKTQARLLADIEKVEKGVFEPRRTKAQQLPEIKGLQKKLRELRDAAYRSDIDAAKLEKALRTIAELEDHLANHTRAVRKGKPLETAELTAVKEKMKRLRSEMKVVDEMARLDEQLRTGEFEVKQRPTPKLTPEMERAQVMLKRKRREIRVAINDMAPIGAKGVGVEAINTARTLKATADMSGTLRQGLILTTMGMIRRPILTSKRFGQSVKATFSKYTAEQIDFALRNDPMYYLMERAKLELTELAGKVTGKEEMFMAKVIEKVPVVGEIVKASNRHMTTYLNLIRKDAFMQFVKNHPNATRTELTAWADVINIFSGRGNLGKFGGAANILSAFVFAPRFAVSRVQAPFMAIKYWKLPRVRAEAAKHLAATAGLGATLLTLADLAGYEVGLDPREADFGKIRVGDTRIDIFAGMQQPMRVAIRIALAGTDRAGLTGHELTKFEKLEIRDLEDQLKIAKATGTPSEVEEFEKKIRSIKEPYGQRIDPLDLIGRFSAFKVAPSVSVPREFLTGETAVGEPTTPTETMLRAMTPMVLESMHEAFKKEGWNHAILAGGLEFFGAGVSTYADNESRIRRDMRSLIKDGDLGGAYDKMWEWNIENPGDIISEDWYDKILLQETE